MSEIRRIAVKAGVCRKEGTDGYGSVGASCEVEVEVEEMTADGLSAAYDRWTRWCEQRVSESIARQRAALPSASALRPAPANGEGGPRRKERIEWDTADHGESARRGHGDGDGRRGDGRNREGVPRSGGALYARLKEMDERDPQLKIVRHVSRWAKARGNDARMSDWDREDVRDGWEVAEQYLEALQESDRLQEVGYRGDAS